MVVTALRGALGFLSRLPVGHDEQSWDAFRRQPATFPLVGYVLGALLAIPLVLVEPPVSAAAVFLVWVYLLTGISHVDGLTDLGDALVVHGDAERRREVMKDTTVGVGGVLVLGLVLLGLTLAAQWLANVALAGDEARLAVVAVVLAAEVGAKAAMAVVVCLGEATHEGLGSSLTEHADSSSLWVVAVATAPVLALAVITPVAPLVTVAALLTSGAVLRIARTNLGGVSGDVLGATNELARIVALHVGVMLWTLS